MMCIHWNQFVQTHLLKTHVNPGHTQYAVAYNLPTGLTSAFATCVLVKLCAYVSLANTQYQFPDLCTVKHSRRSFSLKLKIAKTIISRSP